jgi:hypothetical protein
LQGSTLADSSGTHDTEAMEISAKDLERQYHGMSDGELLSIDPEELTPVARNVHAAEMERRGLDAAAPDHQPDAAFAGDGAERWVCAGIFRFEDEIRALLPALHHAGVQAEIETDPDELIWMGTANYAANRLLVPDAQLDDARTAIERFAAAEELHARNEAAPTPRVVTARYEDGVFKPVEPVEDLQEGTEVDIELPR